MTLDKPHPVRGLYPFGMMAKILSLMAILVISLLVAGYVLLTADGAANIVVGRILKISGLIGMLTMVSYSVAFHFATKGKYAW